VAWLSNGAVHARRPGQEHPATLANSLLHYRAWQGQFHSAAWSVWPIARVALATLFSRRMFWVLYAAGLLLFLMFFFGTYLLDWAQTQLATAQVQIGSWQTDPERMMRFFTRTLSILNGSRDTFAYFFVYQGAMVMVVLALAGSILVGNDFTHRTLPFYLAKPLSPWHYVLGKCLAVGVVVNLLTTLPALVLFAQHGLDEWEYFTNPDFFIANGGRGPASWPLLLGILGYGLVLTVFLSILLVATATWVRRTMPLIMIWTSLFLFLRLLANILVEGLKYHERWRLIDLWNNLCLVGFACLGFEHEKVWPRPQPPFHEAALVLLGVSILCLIYLSRRTRAVEIVR
jgi:hypothetical protein